VSAGESVPDFLDIDYVNIEAGTAPIFLPHELAIESHVTSGSCVGWLDFHSLVGF
jgi:hypothetical protein